MTQRRQSTRVDNQLALVPRGARSVSAPLSTNLQASLEALSRISKRIARLEDVWDAQIPQEEEPKKLGLKKSQCLVQMQALTASDPLSHAFQMTQNQVRGEIWANGLSSNTVKITKIIQAKEMTNGLRVPTVICEGTIDNIQAVFKFRKVMRVTSHLTENEVGNALQINGNEKAQKLFAKLLCVLKITFFDEIWEATGTELMYETDPSDSTNPLFYEACAQCLKQLHEAGFMHGDAHRGNFMKKFISWGLDQSANWKILMIDQDRMQRLPTNDDGLKKFYIICDYCMLLFYGNPLCPSYAQIPGDQLNSTASKVFSAFINEERRFSLLFTPIHPATIENLSTSALLQILTSIIVNGQTYISFIESNSIEDIDDYFKEKFNNAEIIKFISSEVHRYLHSTPQPQGQVRIVNQQPLPPQQVYQQQYPVVVDPVPQPVIQPIPHVPYGQYPQPYGNPIYPYYGQ